MKMFLIIMSLILLLGVVFASPCDNQSINLGDNSITAQQPDYPMENSMGSSMNALGFNWLMNHNQIWSIFSSPDDPNQLILYSVIGNPKFITNATIQTPKLLINETDVEQEIITLKTQINQLNNQNTLMKNELCKTNKSYTWCKKKGLK